jgi:hypothetical protein
MSEPFRNARRLSDKLRRRARRGGGGGDDMPVYQPGRNRDEREQRANRPSPIAVPDDYSVPYVRGGESLRGMSARGAEAWAGSMGQQRPRYRDGDQFRPASLDPASIGRLQASMAAAGLLTDFRYGVWDNDSRKAYEALLGEANAAGLTAEAALRQRAAGIDFGGGGGRSGSDSGGGGGGGGHWEFDENGEPVFIADQYVPPPLELKRTNRDDLVRAIRTGVIDTMGAGWNSAQVGELADLYLQREEAIQREAYNRRVSIERTAFSQGESAVAGMTFEEPTLEDPETFLQNELKRRDPAGYQVGGLVNDAMPAFVNALKGWV